MQEKDFTIRKKKSRKDVELAVNRGSMTVVANGKTSLIQNGPTENGELRIESRENNTGHSLSRISSREYANSINQDSC